MAPPLLSSAGLQSSRHDVKRLLLWPKHGISRAGLFGRIALANLLALLPLAAFAVLQMMAVRDGLALNRGQAALGMTLQAARPVTNKLTAAETLTANLATLMPGLLQNLSSCTMFFDSLIRANPDYSWLGYQPLPGNPPCGDDDLNSELERLQLPPRADSHEPEMFLGLVAGNSGRSLVLGASHPVFDAANVLAGHIVVTIPHHALQTPEIPINHGLRANPIALITFDERGRVLTSSVSLAETGPRLPLNHNLADLANGPAQSFADDSLRGIPRIYAVAPIGQNLYLLGAWARDDDMLQLGEVISGYLLAGLMGVSGLVAALFAAERLVIQHIRKLAAAMNRFAHGDRRNPDPDLRDPPREIGELALAYGDLTQTIFRDEAEMANYLHEKEKLLRELHHRTGNSMQLIASILRMHLREDPDPEVRLILENLHDRVMGLSTVHLGLYRISDYDVAEIHSLLQDVITKIDALRGSVTGKQRVTAALEPLSLSIAQAVPLALLAAEVVSAFLYGSPVVEGRSEENPRLVVQLKRLPDTPLVTLSVTGPASARSRMSGVGGGAPGAIATRLIRGFLRQIDGEMEMTEAGDRLTVKFTFVARFSGTQTHS